MAQCVHPVLGLRYGRTPSHGDHPLSWTGGCASGERGRRLHVLPGVAGGSWPQRAGEVPSVGLPL